MNVRGGNRKIWDEAENKIQLSLFFAYSVGDSPKTEQCKQKSYTGPVFE